MKRPHLWLRLIQILTGITALAIVFMVLVIFNIIPFETLNFGATGESEVIDRIKIKRPRNAQNVTYEQLLNDGDAALFRGNRSAALEFYKRASEGEPREALPYEKIGDLYFEDRDYPAARSNFELALSLDTTKGGVKMKIVKSLIGLRKIVEARETLAEIAPPTQLSLFYEGLIAAFLNEQTNAEEKLQKSIAAGTDETLKQHAQKIIGIYQEVGVARDSPIEFLQTLLAAGLDEVGAYGLSIELAFDALKTKHDYRDAWIVLGHAFLNEHKWQDAEDALGKALALDAENASALFFRGIARRQLQKPEEAIKDFEAALQKDWQPKILAKEQLAESFFDTKSYVKAFPLYKEVVMTDPADINRFIRPMALAINHLNQPAEAEILAKKAFESHPDSAIAYNLLGWAALSNNHFPEAHEHLAQAVKRDPELAAAYLNLGQLAEKESKFDDALQQYQKAKELAESQGEESIGETAEVRYNDLSERMASEKVTGVEPKAPTPQPTTGPAPSSPGSKPGTPVAPPQPTIESAPESRAPASPLPATPPSAPASQPSQKIPSLSLQ